MKEPTVESVMRTKVVTARPETTFKEVVALMGVNAVSGLPVVDGDNRPLGVVSEADTLVKQELRGGTGTRPWLGGRRKARWRKATGRTAGELMTTPAIAVTPGTTISAAARRMAEKNVRRLCVVDETGTLVGVVSRRDVIRTFLRTDDEIRADIEEHVFKRGMWVFPGTLTVTVADGVATVDGSVERLTTAQIAGRLTQAVPGVVGVVNNVRYEFDDTVTSPL